MFCVQSKNEFVQHRIFSNRNNALDPVRNYGGKNGTV